MVNAERDEKPVGVAVLGLGNVGSEVVRIIEESADDLAARIGAPLVLRGVGVRGSGRGAQGAALASYLLFEAYSFNLRLSFCLCLTLGKLLRSL